MELELLEKKIRRLVCKLKKVRFLKCGSVVKGTTEISFGWAM